MRDEFARRGDAGDPAAHFILGVLGEHRDQFQDLKQAFLHYTIAEKLFRERGREYQSGAMRRGALARILPPDEVAKLWKQAEQWRVGGSGRAASRATGPTPTAGRKLAWHPVLTGVDLNKSADTYRLAKQAIDAIAGAVGLDAELQVLRGDILLAHAKTIIEQDAVGAVSLLQLAQAAFEGALARESGDTMSFDQLDETLTLLSAHLPSSDCTGPLTRRVDRFNLWSEHHPFGLDRMIARVDAQTRLGTCLAKAGLAKAGQNAPAITVLREAARHVPIAETVSNASDDVKQKLWELEIRLGDALVQVGEEDTGLGTYSQALALLEDALRFSSANELSGDASLAFIEVQRKMVVLLKQNVFNPGITEALKEGSLAALTVAEHLVSENNADAALDVLQNAIAIRAKLFSRDPSNTNWQTDTVALYQRTSNILGDKGDLDGAQAATEESVAIAQDLAKRDPSNTNWQDSLAWGYGLLGDILKDKGDLDGAKEAAEKRLAIAQRLAEREPTNTDLQYNLAWGYGLLGDILKYKDDRDGAKEAAEKRLAIAQRLAERDPTNIEWQNNLGWGYNRIVDILKDKGDLDGAQEAAEKSVAIAQDLAKRDPSNTNWQTNLVAGYEQTGGILKDKGDLDGAQEAAKKSVAIAQNLAKRDPSNTAWQYNLSIVHYELGNILRDKGDLDGAQEAAEKSVAIIQDLETRDPSNTNWQFNLSVVHYYLGNILRDKGDRPGAQQAHDRGLTIVKKLTEGNQAIPAWLDQEHSLAAAIFEDQRQYDQAIEEWDEVIRIDDTDTDAWTSRCGARAIVGQLLEALADCNASLKLKPQDVRTLNNRGLVYLKSGQPENAIADYDAALRLSPRMASSMYGRGLAKIMKGDSTGGNLDLTAARAMKATVADEFADYRIQ